MTFTKAFSFTGFFVFIVITGILCSCEETTVKEENTQVAGEYLDIEAIVNYLQKDLSAINPEVVKFSRFNEKYDTTTITNIDWKKELQPFEAIYLNKPSLKGAFSYGSRIKDSVIVSQFQRKKDVKTPILFVTAIYTPSNKLLGIRSKVAYKNIIFSEVKNYEFDFDTSTSKPITLKSYAIQGNQGFILGKRDWYRVEGKIN